MAANASEESRAQDPSSAVMACNRHFPRSCTSRTRLIRSPLQALSAKASAVFRRSQCRAALSRDGGAVPCAGGEVAWVDGPESPHSPAWCGWRPRARCGPAGRCDHPGRQPQRCHRLPRLVGACRIRAGLWLLRAPDPGVRAFTHRSVAPAAVAQGHPPHAGALNPASHSPRPGQPGTLLDVSEFGRRLHENGTDLGRPPLRTAAT